MPLIKNKDNWKSSIIDALTLSTNIMGEPRQAGEVSNGDNINLGYTDYLRLFLLFMDKELLTDRAMDMVEIDVRKSAGNKEFRIDACIDTIVADIKTESAFGYKYEYLIRKEYE